MKYYISNRLPRKIEKLVRKKKNIKINNYNHIVESFFNYFNTFFEVSSVRNFLLWILEVSLNNRQLINSFFRKFIQESKSIFLSRNIDDSRVDLFFHFGLELLCLIISKKFQLSFYDFSEKFVDRLFQILKKLKYNKRVHYLSKIHIIIVQFPKLHSLLFFFVVIFPAKHSFLNRFLIVYSSNIKKKQFWKKNQGIHLKLLILNLPSKVNKSSKNFRIKNVTIILNELFFDLILDIVNQVIILSKNECKYLRTFNCLLTNDTTDLSSIYDVIVFFFETHLKNTELKNKLIPFNFFCSFSFRCYIESVLSKTIKKVLNFKDTSLNNEISHGINSLLIIKENIFLNLNYNSINRIISFLTKHIDIFLKKKINKNYTIWQRYFLLTIKLGPYGNVFSEKIFIFIINMKTKKMIETIFKKMVTLKEKDLYNDLLKNEILIKTLFTNVTKNCINPFKKRKTAFLAFLFLFKFLVHEKKLKKFKKLLNVLNLFLIKENSVLTRFDLSISENSEESKAQIEFMLITFNSLRNFKYFHSLGWLSLNKNYKIRKILLSFLLILPGFSSFYVQSLQYYINLLIENELHYSFELLNSILIKAVDIERSSLVEASFVSQYLIINFVQYKCHSFKRVLKRYKLNFIETRKIWINEKKEILRLFNLYKGNIDKKLRKTIWCIISNIFNNIPFFFINTLLPQILNHLHTQKNKLSKFNINFYFTSTYPSWIKYSEFKNSKRLKHEQTTSFFKKDIKKRFFEKYLSEKKKKKLKLNYESKFLLHKYCIDGIFTILIFYFKQFFEILFIPIFLKLCETLNHLILKEHTSYLIEELILNCPNMKLQGLSFGIFVLIQNEKNVMLVLLNFFELLFLVS